MEAMRLQRNDDAKTAKVRGVNWTQASDEPASRRQTKARNICR
jgi:hypothetical protein